MDSFSRKNSEYGVYIAKKYQKGSIDIADAQQDNQSDDQPPAAQF